MSDDSTAATATTPEWPLRPWLLAGLLGNLLVLRMIGMRFMHGEKLATAEACSTAVGWDKLALANAGPPE